MALAKKCDRCGKFYEDYPIGYASGPYNTTGQFQIIQRNITGETINGYTVYDFCPECIEEFEKFMAAKRGE